MILGIGTDIVKVARINKSISLPGFVEKVFTSQEIAYCHSRTNPSESFAARFAAKEAVFKAIGTGWKGDMKFTDIEIMKDIDGKPFIHLHGEAKNICHEMKVNKIHLSLSHTDSSAVAMVIVEAR